MNARRMISANRLAGARRFLHAQGRPLEAALFRYHFESAPREDVISSLALFQNPDGGFGQALEPDLRAPESSAIATSVALQVLRSLDAVDEDETLAGLARAYLLKTLRPALPGWRIVPKTTDASPHAPWWQQAGRPHDYDKFGLNPTAELLGYLYEWADHIPEKRIGPITAAVMEALASRQSLEMHDLLCCLRLFATPGLPEALHDTLEPALRTGIHQAVGLDREAWQSYGLRPLQVVEDPASPFLAGLESAVSTNLDYEIETQEEDGAWYPTWSWGDDYPQVWPVARREWAGVVTLRNLLRLRAFGRIEGLS